MTEAAQRRAEAALEGRNLPRRDAAEGSEAERVVRGSVTSTGRVDNFPDIVRRSDVTGRGPRIERLRSEEAMLLGR